MARRKDKKRAVAVHLIPIAAGVAGAVPLVYPLIDAVQRAMQGQNIQQILPALQQNYVNQLPAIGTLTAPAAVTIWGYRKLHVSKATTFVRVPRVLSLAL